MIGFGGLSRLLCCRTPGGNTGPRAPSSAPARRPRRAFARGGLRRRGRPATGCDDLGLYHRLSQALSPSRPGISTRSVMFMLSSLSRSSHLIRAGMISLREPYMTGLASQFEELITKQLQLLKEALPRLSRVALLHYSAVPSAVLTAAETAARSLGLTARTLHVTGVADFEDAFKVAQGERAGAIQALPSPHFNAHRARLIELAARYRLPAFYEFGNYVQDGGLMS
jgi:hypothetical protein